MQKLKQLEQTVVTEFYFKDLNQTEIARQLGISCNYVSHILRNSTKKLKKILVTDELPPPSIRLVADRLGQTIVTLRHYFPELCRSIASRHRCYREAHGARRRTRLRERVRDAAIALTRHGEYPSANHIADLPVKSSTFHDEDGASACAPPDRRRCTAPILTG